MKWTTDLLQNCDAPQLPERNRWTKYILEINWVLTSAKLRTVQEQILHFWHYGYYQHWYQNTAMLILYTLMTCLQRSNSAWHQYTINLLSCLKILPGNQQEGRCYTVEPQTRLCSPAHLVFWSLAKQAVWWHVFNPHHIIQHELPLQLGSRWLQYLLRVAPQTWDQWWQADLVFNGRWYIYRQEFTLKSM
jgi:hypothetical protein